MKEKAFSVGKALSLWQDRSFLHTTVWVQHVQ